MQTLHVCPKSKLIVASSEYGQIKLYNYKNLSKQDALSSLKSQSEAPMQNKDAAAADDTDTPRQETISSQLGGQCISIRDETNRADGMSNVAAGVNMTKRQSFLTQHRDHLPT